MKKDQSLANKNVQSNNSSGKPIPDSYSNYRPKSPYQNAFAEVYQTEEFHKIIHKTVVADQRVRIIGIEKNYSRSNSNRSNYSNNNRNSSDSNSRNKTILRIVQEIDHTIEIKIIQTKETKNIR